MAVGYHKRARGAPGEAGRLSFVLLCYLSSTIPIYISCGLTGFEPHLILNLFYDDIIIFYCYKLTVGFNLPYISAALGDHLVSCVAFQFYDWDQEWSLKGTWETMKCGVATGSSVWWPLPEVIGNGTEGQAGHEAHSSVWKVNFLTFTQAQPLI